MTGKGAQKENRETGNEIIMIPKLKRGIELPTGMVEHRMQRFQWQPTLDFWCLGAKHTTSFKPGKEGHMPRPPTFLPHSSLCDEDPVQSETWLPGAYECLLGMYARDTWNPSIQCLNFFMASLCTLLLDTSCAQVATNGCVWEYGWSLAMWAEKCQLIGEEGRDHQKWINGYRNHFTVLNMNLPLQGFVPRIINRGTQKGGRNVEREREKYSSKCCHLIIARSPGFTHITHWAWSILLCTLYSPPHVILTTTQ